MTTVTRLVTSVEVTDEVADDRRLSVAARHEAVLTDGRRVLLLDDRGWSVSGPSGVWATTSVEDVVETARTVVGPDEPFDGRTAEQMAADHWGHLAQELRRQGVGVEPGLLRSLPHDVVLGERLLARLTLGGGAG